MNFNISCRTYVLGHFPFGLLLMFIMNIYTHRIKDYTHEPMFTSLAYELRNFFYPTGIIIFFLMMFLFALSRLLFKSDALNRKKYKSLPDEAFLHGLSMMFLSVICYLGIWFVFKQ